ncbi:WbqC family protein [Vibrio sp. St2]|uniref:WbqC family protein n=1 Tax=Vibrio sp. St2 TaxID=2853441 RepID=UPI00248D80D2|nr:WbqC family protein [Vibrio sp. St2]
MKVAIMQPTYIPWVGYFAMMNSVDRFVILDHVQFSRRSWQQRNRILSNGKEQLLSLSVRKADRSTPINEIELTEPNGNFGKHLKTIHQSYSKSEYFDLYYNDLLCLSNEVTSLCDLNVKLINYIKEQLSIETELIFSSNLNVEGTKSELMFNICSKLGATSYLSAMGSKEYMESESGFDFNKVSVEYFDYKPKSYPQGLNDFVPYMSALDLLFNVGTKSRLYL